MGGLTLTPTDAVIEVSIGCLWVVLLLVCSREAHKTHLPTATAGFEPKGPHPQAVFW